MVCIVSVIKRQHWSNSNENLFRLQYKLHWFYTLAYIHLIHVDLSFCPDHWQQREPADKTHSCINISLLLFIFALFQEDSESKKVSLYLKWINTQFCERCTVLGRLSVKRTNKSITSFRNGINGLSKSRTECPVSTTITLLMMQHITLIHVLIDFYQAIVCNQTRAELKQISCAA